MQRSERLWFGAERCLVAFGERIGLGPGVLPCCWPVVDGTDGAEVEAGNAYFVCGGDFAVAPFDEVDTLGGGAVSGEGGGCAD